MIARLFFATLCCCAAGASACASGAGAPEATPDERASPGAASATVLRQGDGSHNAVALVFDLGDDAGRTAQALATLRDAGVRASFAVTGRWAEAHPELMRAIALDGHQFLNGTYAGSSLTGVSTGTAPLTAGDRALAMSRAETSVYRATNRSTRPFLRPPYGDSDASVERDAALNGYSVIVLPELVTPGRDGAGPPRIIDYAINVAVPGAIIALDAGGDSVDADALPAIIDALRARGLAFETVAEISGLGGRD